MSKTKDSEIELRYRNAMQRLADVIDTVCNPDGGRKTGFVLLMFELDAPGRANYISNSNREDIIILFKEMITRFEGQAQPKEGQV
jgi:hypothetical protein